MTSVIFQEENRHFDDARLDSDPETRESENKEIEDGELEIPERSDKRSSRYIGNTCNNDAFGDLKPFYSGANLDTRVIDFREGLTYVRSHWDEFETFVKSLKTLLFENETVNFESEATEQLVEILLSRRRDMLSHDEIGNREVSYEAIKVYTSTEGYRQVYGRCNKISRQDNSVTSKDLIRAVAFLWELISVDLHNYCMTNPEKRNYQGIVYRGQIVNKQEIEDFRSLKTCPVHKRSMAVPLGLLSSTKSKQVAKKFINNLVKYQNTSTNESLNPMLYKIHVIGVRQEHVDIYTSKVPSSFMTSLYVVDIEEMSNYPKEKEVLLRTPFFQVLDIYQDKNFLTDGPCEVVEAVTVNADRDFKSAFRLSEEENVRARNMMKCMTEISRYQFAEQYCVEKQYFDEAREYKHLLEESEIQLQEITRT